MQKKLPPFSCINYGLYPNSYLSILLLIRMMDSKWYLVLSPIAWICVLVYLCIFYKRKRDARLNQSSNVSNTETSTTIHPAPLGHTPIQQAGQYPPVPPPSYPQQQINSTAPYPRQQFVPALPPPITGAPYSQQQTGPVSPLVNSELSYPGQPPMGVPLPPPPAYSAT